MLRQFYSRRACLLLGKNYSLKAKSLINVRYITYDDESRLQILRCQSTDASRNSLSIKKSRSSEGPPYLPSQSQIVIAGAGTVANSVAYHLVLNGWNDVLVLEQNTIGSGSSHFGSGTLGLFKPISHRNLIAYSIKLYQQLQEMGYDIGLRQCGSINLAQSKDRMVALKRRMAYNVPTGLHCEILGKEELKRLHPYLHIEDIEGAIWVPEDAVANLTAICEVLAKLAKQGGAQYVEHCRVEEIKTEKDAVKSVKTEYGTVSCQYFINCAGMVFRTVAGRSASRLTDGPPSWKPLTTNDAQDHWIVTDVPTGSSQNLRNGDLA